MDWLCDRKLNKVLLIWWPRPGEMIMNCSWTFMNSSWMFVNKKLWTFLNAHQRVHERFKNILEQQMSSWTYSVHELPLCSWTWVVHERSWTQIIHEQGLVHERPWTQQIMNQIVNKHSWTFIKCVHELFMNVPEQQMSNSWTVNLKFRA